MTLLQQELLDAAEQRVNTLVSTLLGKRLSSCSQIKNVYPVQVLPSLHTRCQKQKCAIWSLHHQANWMSTFFATALLFTQR